MSKDPAFLFYSQDFIVGVQTMSFEDRGKYITILCQMHQQGRLDEETIRFIVGYVSDRLRLKFKIDNDGLWYNERLEHESNKRSHFTESRRINGKNGGRPKNSKPYGKPINNHMRNHMDNHMGNENDNVISNIEVAKILCLVFAKEYKEPQQRMSAEVGFYKDIDTQAELISQVHTDQEKAIAQIKAYIKHCKQKDRKLIGTAYKLSETILSADWVKLNNPETSTITKNNSFDDAEYNRTLWTPEAWNKHYWHMKDNPEFKKHFNL